MRKRAWPAGGVRVRAFAKINLGLEVLGTRSDGYHELRTIFQTIDLHDELVLRPRPRGVTLRCDHPGVPTDGTNLAVRAAEALISRAGGELGVAITLVKRIPVAGGLGGGSSDAAAVLLGLDRQLGLGLGADGLQPLARRLGADVPYFLTGGTALGLARGDEVYPLFRQVRGHVVIIDLGRPLSTAAVFARLDSRLTPRENSYTIYRFVSRDLEGSGGFSVLTNDLEPAALEEAPDLAERIARIRGLLVGEGALLASLSGSGASFFGLFDGARKARRAQTALESEGHRTIGARTLTLDQYRRALSGGRPGSTEARSLEGPGKERTTWRSRTSRSSR